MIRLRQEPACATAEALWRRRSADASAGAPGAEAEALGTGNLRRLPDWPERLAAFLEARRAEPKRWGYNDCALLCADGIEAVTGLAVAEELRGYDSPAGAFKALAAYLVHRNVPLPNWKRQPDSLLTEVAARIAAAQGFAPIAPGLAQRGDAVLLDVAGLWEEENRNWKSEIRNAPLSRFDFCRWTRALGIVGMSGLPVTAGEHGTVELPAERIVRAWRVG